MPLAPLTTLGVGGPARWLGRLPSADHLEEALAFAREEGTELMVLGGGSNVLVADAGIDRVVVTFPEVEPVTHRDGRLEVEAGASWDRVVEQATTNALAGIECLAGIPGSAGATPIQNVGAYGQEVGERIEVVRAFDKATGGIVELDREACGFRYRDSFFKTEQKGRYVVVSMRLSLEPGGAPTLRYPELARAAEDLGDDRRSLEAVRRLVIALRRKKGMVLDETSPNRHSAGSFFTNPILSADAFAELEARTATVLGEGERLPRFDAGDGRTKVPAAWLIERAGMKKGYGDGPVGLSTQHTLAIVNRGGARASDIVAFAEHVRARVLESFGVELVPEPEWLGFDRVD